MATLHRLDDRELPAVFSLLAAAGGTARSLESWKQDRMTALVLGVQGENPTAVMPLSRRTIHAAPLRSLNVGWLSSNQFASRMSLRRQTRDNAPDWATLLPELDALLVLRRDESSLAARWYAQTGFENVLSVRCLYLDMDAPPAARSGNAPEAATGRYQVQVASPGNQPADPKSSDPSWLAQAPRWQSQMLAVYQDVYGSFGGPQERTHNFWAPTLANHFYRDHYQFQIIGLWNAADTLMGYAVVGWSGWHSKRPRMDILELATRQWDTAVAADLIQTTCQLAWSKNVRQVRAVISSHDPYRGHLNRTGFIDRWGYVMLARWLNPQRYLDRLAADPRALPAELGDLAIELSAPGQVPLSLRRGTPGAALHPPIQLQADARILTRLLLNRLDIAASLQEGTLVPTHGIEKLPDPDITRLSLAFPWTPWAFHLLDYI